MVFSCVPFEFSCDKIVSRNEHDANGPLETKIVEEVFRRTACIWHLHVNGQGIRNTTEHPFFEKTKGWVKAGLLSIGDVLLGKDGELAIPERP